ncbi:RNA-binding protein 19 [Asbolus verrucosus]|uniref:RNA-binding protein 19 n=1 Tax=Asbolus verrucosus TaxID=1661398 RepID=A0A482VG40_ASBVE|nr:RNA-binding protein 19 [Asbolus verrucosus]
MSRITEEKIRRLFEEKGTITDVQLKYTADGKFRQFAFVGYQLENEAEEAIKCLNNMFINTSRIKVESCALLGDTKKPKAWSKYAPDSSAYKKIHSVAVVEDDDKLRKSKTKYQDDPMFEEFLELHAPEEKKKLHKIVERTSIETQENDNVDESEHDETENETDLQNKLADEKISDLEYMHKLMKKKETKQASTKKEPKNIELFTLKLKGLPYSCKKKDIKHFLKPVTPFSIRRPTKIHGIAYVGFKTEKDFKKALLKDRTGKRISVAKYSKIKSDNLDSHDNIRKNKWSTQEEAIKNEETIAESGKIFIRNLAYTTTEDDIENLFKKFGPLAEVNLPIDSVTKKIKGFGTVVFVMPEHAVKAYGDLDGSVLHGRMLHLLPGKSKDVVENEIPEESSNYKKKKAAKEKSQAGSSHNWNSLFLGHNAVAEVIADNYNTSKEKVLAIHGQDSAAVRLALGETQIVAQTKKYLEQEGVILDAFSNTSSKRSKTVIIVKNLPSKTEGKEIRKLFEKYGLIGRIILPPSGITALVEFVEPSEARKAFTSLAYTKFKHVPLYLEWAPENSLTDKKPSLSEKEEIKESESQKADEINEETVEEAEPDTTLFVKNLNFQTTDEDLKKYFEGCGKVVYATVATKKDKTDPNRRLSMGYGFVRFLHKISADKALKTLQQSVLDGKSLELKRSERTLNNEVNTTRKSTKLVKQTGTKILVRNVPFQANSKEIRELFSTFGEIKALRLPKKMTLNDGSHRGFAFVDYVTASDAKVEFLNIFFLDYILLHGVTFQQAFEALSQSTHLYGRRLVLEWAASEEGVEEIRKRTAAHFKAPEAIKSKKSVFNLD